MEDLEYMSKNLKATLGITSLSKNVPHPKFTNLGLWEVCFNGFHDMRHQYDTRFYGCKHILLEEYAIVQSEIQPPFFVVTQIFYTLGLTGLLLAVLLILIYVLCIDDFYRVRILKWTGIDLISSGALGSIALIIFGVYGDARDYMPDWENNYISWSFGLGFVGVILEFIAGALFVVESRILNRKEIALENQYPMEKRAAMESEAIHPIYRISSLGIHDSKSMTSVHHFP
ncbi:Uncharacterized protein FKW44_020055 [Caligus rogercresseyi]|uniref:Uncharacterized protein n=1 Tax=Caligus rogercresseyi TaxID=217165 RepID=A0A7T8JYV0_CALRO|nr:Uncharacterized protein FKW44_020055 [Caligus rogercresseyi]